MTDQNTEQIKLPPPAPISRQDLDTTIRVLRTLDEFQAQMQSSQEVRGNFGFITEYKSSLEPAVEMVTTFRNWFSHLAPNQ